MVAAKEGWVAAKAITFYTHKLGFRILTDQAFDEKQRWIELRIPGSEAKVVLFTPPGHEDRIGTFSNVFKRPIYIPLLNNLALSAASTHGLN